MNTPRRRGRPTKAEALAAGAARPDPRTVDLEQRNRAIVEAFEGGKKVAELAAEFELTRQRLWQIINGIDLPADVMVAVLLRLEGFERRLAAIEEQVKGPSAIKRQRRFYSGRVNKS